MLNLINLAFAFDRESEMLFEKWQKVGVIVGSDSGYEPDGNVTVAELAAILNRVFMFPQQNPIIALSDVSPGDWFYQDIQRLCGAGIINAYNGKIGPNERLSRERAFTILARACEVNIPATYITSFSDDQFISNWAMGACQLFKNKGYLSSISPLDPQRLITRAELLKVLDSIAGEIITDSNPISNDKKSGLVIKKAEKEFSDTKVAGNLYWLLEGNQGIINLKNTDIEGTLFIGSVVPIVSKDHSTRIKVEIDNCKIQSIIINRPAEFSINGQIGALQNNADVKIAMNANSQIERFNASMKANVTGEGSIDFVLLERLAFQSTFERKPDALLDIAQGVYSGKSNLAGLNVIDGRRFYLNDDGRIQTGFVNTGDKSYYFTSDGKNAAGMITLDGNTYYLDSQGAKQTGLIDYEGHTYYFSPEGIMSKGLQIVNGKNYYFDENGRLVKGKLSKEYNIDSEGVALPRISTGNTALDQSLDEIIQSITYEGMPIIDQQYAVYSWVRDNLSYLGIAVDTTNGYNANLVNKLSIYALENYKGSCEHVAALLKVFLDRLGTEAIVVTGSRYSYLSLRYSDHAWVLTKSNSNYFHCDPLFERNHTKTPKSGFMRNDEYMSGHHRWDRSAYPASN